MEELVHTVRYTLRGLRKSPAFTVVAVATLALGIGVNATIFSLVSSVLLRPLAVDRPSELVNIYGRTIESSSHDASSYPNYLDYRAQSETVSGLIAYTNFYAHLSIEGGSELVVGETVSDNYFEVLGVQPVLGRAFVSEEFTAPGAASVAILSHAFWRTRFAANPDVLGRSFRMNRIVYTVDPADRRQRGRGLFRCLGPAHPGGPRDRTGRS